MSEDERIQEMNDFCKQMYLREKSLVPDCNTLAYRKGKHRYNAMKHGMVNKLKIVITRNQIFSSYGTSQHHPFSQKHYEIAKIENIGATRNTPKA